MNSGNMDLTMLLRESKYKWITTHSDPCMNGGNMGVTMLRKESKEEWNNIFRPVI